MHERHVLFRGLGMSVVDFRCRAAVEPAGREEPNPTHSIVFVRRGVFGRAVGKSWRVVDANSVVFFNAEQSYRYAHPLPGGDDCTILAVDEERARELVSAHSPQDGERREGPFRVDHLLASARLARLHYELLALVRRGDPRLIVEDALAGLADAAVAAAHGLPRSAAAEELGTRRQREIAEAVKVELNARLDAPPGLTELAAAFGCSPFHLSRLFSRREGISLRTYLGRLRTRLAAERLAGGARDLTGLALDLGYSDHSHFTNAFRREWGLPPSRFRQLAAGERSASAERRLERPAQPAHRVGNLLRQGAAVAE
jgi:AraC-like DNA-binding protein